MKKRLSFLLAVLLLLSLPFSLSGCGKKPTLGDIYDRVVELVEASVPLNTVFYGSGLPVYAQDSEYADLMTLYYGFDYGTDYEIVSPYSPYSSVDAIKTAASSVYSRDYCDKSLFASAFDGFAFQDATGKSHVSVARYLESPMNGLLQSADESNRLFTGVRIYDYATMEIQKPTTATSVYVVMDTYTESDSSPLPVRLHLVLEDGQWMLDSFTGG